MTSATSQGGFRGGAQSRPPQKPRQRLLADLQQDQDDNGSADQKPAQARRRVP